VEARGVGGEVKEKKEEEEKEKRRKLKSSIIVHKFYQQEVGFRITRTLNFPYIKKSRIVSIFVIIES
jgi:hypothetical protein